MAAIVVVVFLVAAAIVATLRYLLSTEFDERDAGCINRSMLQDFPLQSFKIIIVVWQILTEVCAYIFEASNISVRRRRP